MFVGRWTCLLASGQIVVFEDSPSLESTQVSGGHSNNRFQGNDTKEQSVDPRSSNRTAVRRSLAPRKKSTLIHSPFAKIEKLPDGVNHFYIA